MARADHKTSIVPSVLDRLIDDAPNESQEPVSGRFQSIREMERVVARDLEALLNARRETLEELPSEFEEVNRSLLTYGLPDLSSFSLLSENDRNKVRRVIEQTIAAAEPRLGRISVKLEPARAHDRDDIGHGKGLDLIVGHIKSRDPQAPL